MNCEKKEVKKITGCYDCPNRRWLYNKGVDVCRFSGSNVSYFMEGFPGDCVLDDDEVDRDMREYDLGPIDIVSLNDLNKFIEGWCNNKSSMPSAMMIAKTDKGWQTLDNSEGMECNLEEFMHLYSAKRYLNRGLELDDCIQVNGLWVERYISLIPKYMGIPLKGIANLDDETKYRLSHLARGHEMMEELLNGKNNKKRV